ncbi:MAG: RNase adapter RapZ [Clostridiales bacterium]|nr:RNase adapter RapZ [Clostridiales bacterium]
MKVVIITGLSGSGKTNAIDWFEDQGFYCIDNMPPGLIKNFIELSNSEKSTVKGVAIGADIRGGEFFKDLDDVIDNLRKISKVESKVLFTEASVETIIRRYNETRRKHPLTGGSPNRDTIEKEIKMLKKIREKADFVLDTSSMKVADLKGEMSRIFLSEDGDNKFTINVSSFGYKYGIPLETDMIFDMRFIPNPFYVKSLKELTGNNKKVANFVLKHQVAKDFVSNLHSMVNSIVPGYVKEGKYHLNIAFGCTGGHHRSVCMANTAAEMFKKDGYRVSLEHRDL